MKSMAPGSSFHFEIEKTSKHEFGHEVTIIRCHGNLVAGTTVPLSDAVKPLISPGCRIVIDLSDLQILDSSGLGALIGLKVSAINQGLCKVELANVPPRVQETLRITNLLEIFAA
jgi:anti-sigma B factor antagonist